MVRPLIFICFLTTLVSFAFAFRPFGRASNELSLSSVEERSHWDVIQELDVKEPQELLIGEPMEGLGQRGYMPRKKHHSFTSGQKNGQTNLLFDANLRMGARQGSVIRQDLHVRVSDDSNRICRIEVTDLHTNQSEQGWASVKSGGSGTLEVVISLESAKSASLDYHVVVYETVSHYRNF